MSTSRQPRKSKPALLGSHQKCWIWGRHTVVETLEAGRWPILELRLSDRLPTQQVDHAQRLARQRNVTVLVEPAARLTRLCRTAEHQGYAAKMPPFPYDDAELLLAAASAQPFYALLDGIHDPYNFGAIIRAAQGLGVDALFVPTRRQCAVTSLVARTSAGAVNQARIARVESLTQLAGRLREMGLLLVAACPGPETSLLDCSLSQPLAVIVGNEGEGIAPELLQLCDVRVNIPLSGNVESLNAAVAAAIVFYEVRRQRTFPD